MDLDDLVRTYFRSGRPYQLILVRLRRIHGLKRSMRWLKGTLKRLGLQRRGCSSLTPTPVVRNCIQHLTSEAGSLLGYRAVWKILREKYKLNVKRYTVMVLLREMDPESVRRRGARQMKRRVYISMGPNHVWHIDQYDKLSKYGFHIHGCIDGFSRKMIWLTVCSTNRDPAVTVGHYIDAVESAGGFPKRVRLDKGTENTLIAQCQVAFSMCCDDDERRSAKSVQYGSSPSNSRIESWWSRLRAQKTDWWIQHFRALERDEWLDTDSRIHKQCLAFAFLPVLEKEMQEYVVYWNTHQIRPTRMASCPSGRPEDMYDLPELFGGENCLLPVPPRALGFAKGLVKRAPLPFSEHFRRNCTALVRNRFNMCVSCDLSPTVCTHIYKYLVWSIT